VDTAALEPPCSVAGLEPGRYALFLGRIVPEKEVHTLIKAFARAHTNMRLAIAGPGTHTGGYVKEVERLAADDPRVVLLGPRYGGEKTWLLQNASLFIQPSKVEGLPIVLMEAMACGRYCLVSDIPEHLEVVRSNGRTFGAVFKSGDEVELALKLEQLLDHPNGAAGGADAGRRHVLARYGWDPIVEQTEREYLAAVAGR
jgi:glycosyltransferase involved in cell wall biosynthesis